MLSRAPSTGAGQRHCKAPSKFTPGAHYSRSHESTALLIHLQRTYICCSSRPPAHHKTLIGNSSLTFQPETFRSVPFSALVTAFSPRATGCDPRVQGLWAFCLSDIFVPYPLLHYFQASALLRSGNRILSNAVRVTVFAPLALVPPSLTLAPGSLFTVSWSSGQLLIYPLRDLLALLCFAFVLLRGYSSRSLLLMLLVSFHPNNSPSSLSSPPIPLIPPASHHWRTFSGGPHLLLLRQHLCCLSGCVHWPAASFCSGHYGKSTSQPEHAAV